MQRSLFPDHLSSEKTQKKPYKLRFPRLPALSFEERQAVGGHMRDDAAVKFSNWGTRKIGDRLFLEADRYCSCGRQFSLIECPHDRALFRSPISCNSRVCETCGRRYAKRLEPAIQELFAPLLAKKVKGFGLFMLTLTTTTNRFGPSGPSHDDIKRFYRESGAFLKLHYGKYKCKINPKGKIVECQKRRGRKPKLIHGRDGIIRKEWREFRGAGYLASLELGTKGNMIHAHAIVYGPYIAQKKLSESWRKMTGDSFIVDIRAIRSPQKAARYVLKYISKPPQTDSLKAVADYAAIIKGTRRIRTGGIFYNRIKKQIIESVKMVCPYCESHLRFMGQQTIADVDAHKSLPLYPMLRELKKRGSPLPYPEDFETARTVLDQLIVDQWEVENGIFANAVA